MRMSRPSKSKRFWGHILYMVSIVMFPLVFGILYLKHRKVLTLKGLFRKFKIELKQMLKGQFNN